MTASEPSLSLLVEQSLAAIRQAEQEFVNAMAEASTLVRQAGQQHADGLLVDARESCADAGDILHDWLGDGEAISELEDALWQGDEDGFEKFMQARSGRRG